MLSGPSTPPTPPQNHSACSSTVRVACSCLSGCIVRPGGGRCQAAESDVLRRRWPTLGRGAVPFDMDAMWPLEPDAGDTALPERPQPAKRLHDNIDVPRVVPTGGVCRRGVEVAVPRPTVVHEQTARRSSSWTATRHPRLLWRRRQGNGQGAVRSRLHEAPGHAYTPCGS